MVHYVIWYNFHLLIFISVSKASFHVAYSEVPDEILHFATFLLGDYTVCQTKFFQYKKMQVCICFYHI